MDELLEQPVRKLAAAIRDGQITSKEVVTAFLDRIEKANPRINALVYSTAEAALKHARNADNKLKNGHLNGPLHGVPFTIKDSLDTKDAITTWGTKGRANFRPGADASSVARLREAGGILLGKTNTPEFTLFFETDNLVYGRTSNPYDITRTAGGSSGGAAALLACNAIPFDLGTDTGGSIRLPAHFAGVCGIKPTTGRVPCTGNALPTSGLLAPLTQVGPMGRFIDDLAYLLPIISGPDLIDQATVACELKDYREVDLKNLRMGFHTDNGIKTPSPEITDNLNEVIDLFREHGWNPLEVRPTGIEMADLITRRLFAAEGGLMVENLLDDSRTEETTAYIQSYLTAQRASSITNRDFAQLISLWHNYQSSMLEYFANHDVLICPVNADTAVPHNSTKDLSGYTYTSAYNLTGWPGVVVRTGTSNSGLPIGTQIISSPFREDIALAVAHWLETQSGEFRGPE
jgi:amidase